jgi:hypothetical protein
MTPAELITLVKGRMLNNTDTTLDDLIILEANNIQDNLQQEAFIPWFLFKDTNDSTNLETVAGTEFVALPADFIREYDEDYTALFRYNPDAAGDEDPWVPMVKDDYSLIKTKYPGAGTPTHYDLLGSRLYLRYIPNDIYTLRMLYWGKDDLIASGGSANLWLTHASDWLMNEVGAIMSSQYVAMPDIHAKFMSNAQVARNRVYKDTLARIEAGRMRNMGDD